MWNENQRTGLRVKRDVCGASALGERRAASPRQLCEIHRGRPAESSVS